MTIPPAVQDELFDLFWSLGNGSFSPADVERVELLARQYPEVRAWYGRFMVMCGVLQWDHATLHGGRLAWDGESGNDEGETTTAGLPADTSAGLGRPLHLSSFPLDPLASVGGVLLSYLCVALLFAAGVVAARWWRPADGRRPLVRNTVVAPPQAGNFADLLTAWGIQKAFAPPVGSAACPGPLIVGKITATSDCHWNESQAAHVGDPVPNGRAYVLASGLLEITYHTGARIILQGPAVYAVDNTLNGGLLLAGKLTVRAAKIDRAALANSERARDHPAPSPRASALCLRTRSAIVFDNGDKDTSFGVEVDGSGATYTHVFYGKITFGALGFEPRPFSAGTCVWTGAGAKHDGLLVFKPGPGPSIFVTEMPKPPPVCLVKPGAGESGRRDQGGG